MDRLEGELQQTRKRSDAADLMRIAERDELVRTYDSMLAEQVALHLARDTQWQYSCQLQL